MVFRLLIVLALACASGATAQELPFLTNDEIRMIVNELSGDRAYEHIRVLSQWHRDSGMEGYFKAADYVMKAAREAGLQDVTFIEQPLRGRNYTARSAELWMVEPAEVKLADIGEHAVYLADGSHDADVTAELVWVGDVTNNDFSGMDLKGKIVLTDRSPNSVLRSAVYEGGAVGIVAYPSSEGRSPMDYPDQIAWSSISRNVPEGETGTFAFILPPRKGETLKRVLRSDQMQDLFATGTPTKGGRVVLKAKVDTEFGAKEPGRTGFVEGWIRGSSIHDQQIVITAHLQEEQGSANDDGSGCANILEIARAFNKLIKEGKMKRPVRDVRFWWTDEIASEYRYFQDHPEEPKKFLANIHQDMVGANQAMGSRVQHIIMAPHSRTSFLDAVYESVGTFLILTNNAFLAASRSGGYPRPYTRPIYSTRGTRDGYNARFVPYFNSSDHMCFVEGAVGVPAVATINWDDPYIHSSDDDLFQIDQTQLRRNAFLTAATAYTLMTATPDQVPLFASEIFTQGARRFGNDLQAGCRVLRSGADRNAAWEDARALIENGVAREQRALASARVFAAPGDSGSRLIDDLIKRLGVKQNALTGDLALYYRTLFGAEPAAAPPDSLQTAAAARVPANVMPLKEYFEKRDQVRPQTTLHGLMRDEVFNFVDGRRSYLDIYRAVRSEQLVAGSWYYGTVLLGDVVRLLDAAVAAGCLTLQPR